MACHGSIITLRQPTPGWVWGVTQDNLMAYTKAALAKFLKEFPGVDGVQFRMHDESGLRENEQAATWKDALRLTTHQQAPNLRIDIRAKGLPDSTIQDAIDAGINMRVSTKFWMEQMGLPFNPTHINTQDQTNRRHSYVISCITGAISGGVGVIMAAERQLLLWASRLCPAFRRKHAHFPGGRMAVEFDEPLEDEDEWAGDGRKAVRSDLATSLL